MQIHSCSFSEFKSLMAHVVDEENPGFAWYVSTNRRVAARLFLDSGTERWRYATYQRCNEVWVEHVSRGEVFLGVAELAMFKALEKRRDTDNNREAAEAGEFPLEKER